MADVRQEREGWSISGYGWTGRTQHPSKLSALKEAIRVSNAMFIDAHLLPVEKLWPKPPQFVRAQT